MIPMRYRLSLYFLCSFGVYALFFYGALNVNYQGYRDVLNSLLAVSAMMFTIMGIWIAFLYPNALRRISDPEKIEVADFSDTVSETRRLEGLVASVLASLFIASFIVVIFFLKAALYNSEFYLSFKVYFKSGAASVLSLLVMVQFEAVAYIAYSNVAFINELHGKRQDREMDRDI